MNESVKSPIDNLRGKLELRNRVIATFVLLTLASALLGLSSLVPKLGWISNVGCGLIVLGAAGIWVSYFAERQALISLKESICSLTTGIDARFSVLKATVEAKIEDLYYDPSNARDVDRYRRDLLHQIEKPRNEIRILAIAAREFLFRDEGFAAGTLESILNPESRKYDSCVSVKILLLHPHSEQAVTRALREHPDRDFDSFEDTNLWQDIKKSCTTICDWKRKNYNIKARLYKVAPSCFLIFVNDVLFAEFYHFGAGGRASGKVPLFRISSTSDLYRELKGHFDYVWETAKCFELADQLFKEIKTPGATKNGSFIQYIRFSRPDLFDLGGIATQDEGANDISSRRPTGPCS
jgi:hypothetical protein